MTDYPIRTPENLPALLQAFRKKSGMTQGEVALRMGTTQQTMSALERNAETVSAARLIRLLNVLGVELVLREKAQQADAGSDASPHW